MWGAICFSRGSSQPRDRPRSPTLQADSLPTELQGKPIHVYMCIISHMCHIMKVCVCVCVCVCVYTHIHIHEYLVLKVWSLEISITWVVCRNVNSWAPPRATKSEILGLAPRPPGDLEVTRI